MSAIRRFGTSKERMANTFTGLSRAGWTVTATNSDAAHLPAAAVDANNSTYWWSGANVPQSLIVDMGSAQTFAAVSVLPSSTFGSDRPTGIDVYVSTDGITWGAAVASVTGLANDATEKIVIFASQTKRYVKVTITTSTGGWTQVGELNIGTQSQIPSGAVRNKPVVKTRVVIIPPPAPGGSGNPTGKGQIFPTGRS